jgi:hypothetical protein
MRRAGPRSTPRLSVAAIGLLLACAPSREQQAEPEPEQASARTGTATDPGPSPADPASAYTIARSQAMPEQAPIDLGLSDSDYWDDPLKTRMQIEDRLLDEDRSLSLIGAPSQVAYQQRDTLPLVFLRVGKQDAVARLPFRHFALLIAQELTTNTTYSGLAVLDDAVPSPPYDGPPLEGMTGEAWVVDLRDRLQLPWTRGELLVSLVMRDAMTHRVRIKLDKGGYKDPAVDAYLAEAEQQPQLASVHPPLRGQDDGRTLPSYRVQTDSPPLPDQLGINLAVPRVISRNPNMRCVIKGSFRLRPLARELAPAGTEVGGADVSAVVGIGLVVTGSDLAAPYQFDLKVPVYDPVATVDGHNEVTGYFALDLQTLANLNAIDQTYFIYALSGELLTGPVPMALVTR